MKRITSYSTNFLRTSIALLLIAIATFSCEKEVITPQTQDTPTTVLAEHEGLTRPDAQCGVSLHVDLHNASAIDVADVEILNDAKNLYILIDMNVGQHLDMVKAFIGDASGIEIYGGGDLNTEEFQYQTILTGVHRYTVTLPLGSLTGSQDVVLYAQTSQRDFFGNVTNVSEAFIDGLPLGNGGYAKYSIGTCSNLTETGNAIN
ncbi:MAG: hypothetical protein AAF570_09665 [Bacteroidota bacterium]